MRNIWFVYKFQGIQRCVALIELGKKLEGLLEINGQFKDRPSYVNVSFKLFPFFFQLDLNEPLAACIIYSAVLATWVFFGLGDNTNSTIVKWIAGVVLRLSTA
jgi:hypothetical protein